jgi:hypothetical protein
MSLIATLRAWRDRRAERRRERREAEAEALRGAHRPDFDKEFRKAQPPGPSV